MDWLNIGYTRSTTEPFGSFAQGDCSWADYCNIFFGKDGLNIGQILRLGNKFPRSG